MLLSVVCFGITRAPLNALSFAVFHSVLQLKWNIWIVGNSVMPIRELGIIAFAGGGEYWLRRKFYFLVAIWKLVLEIPIPRSFALKCTCELKQPNRSDNTAYTSTSRPATQTIREASGQALIVWRMKVICTMEEHEHQPFWAGNMFPIDVFNRVESAGQFSAPLALPTSDAASSRKT